MANVLIVFASMSGSTEEMAYLIEEGLNEAGVETTLKQIDFDKIEVETFSEYDGVLIGTYTDGDGDIPYETEDFFDELEQAELAGKPAALFGSCDSLYPYYGGAVDQFEDRLTEKGASILLESLKVDLSPDKEDEQRCREFAVSFADVVAQQRSPLSM